MEQGVNGGHAVKDAELAFQGGMNLRSAQGVDPILGLRTGVDPVAKPLKLCKTQKRGAAAARAMVKASKPFGVVTRDPVLNRSPGTPKRLRDVGGLHARAGRNQIAELEKAIFKRL